MLTATVTDVTQDPGGKIVIQIDISSDLIALAPEDTKFQVSLNMSGYDTASQLADRQATRDRVKNHLANLIAKYGKANRAATYIGPIRTNLLGAQLTETDVRYEIALIDSTSSTWAVLQEDGTVTTVVAPPAQPPA